jgi:iron complex transport system substrate-binding protein
VYGSTTIPAAPQRVVALGYNDQDPILALGVQPVAVRYWFGHQTRAVFPWAADALGTATPIVLNMPFGELNLEAIAAVQPDLIIGVSSGITDEEYANLSQIAPTVAQSAEYVSFGVPWQEQTLVIGRALGAEARAEELVAATEARFAAIRAEHPQFEGATAVIAAPAADGQFYFSGPQHERQRVLTSLGFVLPEELAMIAGDAFYGTISGERLDLLDTDLLVWTATPAERATIEANPLYQTLAAVKEGRVVWLDTSGTSDAELVGPALVFSSVLSLPIVFDELVPLLAAAVDGDPATAAAGTATLAIVSETSNGRLVRHPRGETLVPLEPNCIVVAGSGYLDHLLTLGVQPCGAAHGPGGGSFPDYLAEQLADVAYVGGTLEVNLEAVAALDPDLIIAMHPAHSEGEFQTPFDPIAPTVYLNEPWADWRQSMREIGLLLGKQQEAAAALAAFDTKITDANARLAQTVGGQKVVFLRVLPEEIRVYGTASPTGDLLFNQLGLAPAALVPVDEHATSISLELIPQLDAEHLFLLDQTEDGMATLTGSPLWGRIPAVAKGQVYPVDVTIWVQGEGMVAYQQLVDEVVARLAE